MNAIPAFGSESAPQCYNDYEKVFLCQFPSNQTNCSGYRMKLPELRNKSCNFKYENVLSECNCYVEMKLIIGSQHTVQFWQNDKLLTSRVINITDTIKPKAPSTCSVKSTVHGHYLVSWKTNYDDSPFSQRLVARLTYWKKGEKRNEVPNIASRHYEIRGDGLEPNTNYTVFVQNFADFSHLYSDSSTKCFFTTVGSTASLLKVIIIVISAVVIVLTSVLFWCYIRFKAKLWDKVPKPTIPQMGFVEKWVLLPSETSFSPVCAEPIEINANKGKARTKPYIIGGSGKILQEGSGMGDGSGSMSYAQTVFLAHDDQAVSITQMPEVVQVIDHVEEELSKVFPNLGRMCETNLNPAFSGDSAYYFNKHDVLSEEKSHTQTSFDSSQVGNNLPLSVSPSLLTDFSYHVCNGESLTTLLTKAPSEPSTENKSNVQASLEENNLDFGYQSFGELVSKDLKEPNLKTDYLSGPDSHKATVIHQMNPMYYYLNANHEYSS